MSRSAETSRSARATRTALIACMLCAAITSCVTEKSGPQRGVRVNPDGSRVTPQGDKAPKNAVATPVPATVASTVRLSIRPIGTIPYDSQCLPLVSPDGRYLATQVGPAPDWSALWATDNATPPASSVEAYSIDQNSIKRIEWPQRPGDALVLGRAANDEGFLVEAIRADGSRVIAQISWASGSAEILAGEPGAVSAHATWTSRNELVYTQRPLDSVSQSVLCIRGRDGKVSTLSCPDGAYAYPMATQDDRFIYAMCVRTPAYGSTLTSLELHAIRIERSSSRESTTFGNVSWSYRLGDATEPSVLHQFAAAVPQAGPVAMTGPDGVARRSDTLAPLTLFRPGSSRVHVIDMDQSRSLPLPPTTVSAAWLNPAFLPGQDQATTPGFLCTTKDGLLFMADPRRVTGRVQPIRLLSRPYLARPLRAPDEYLLVGPVANAPDRLEVVRARIGGQ